MKAFNKIVVPTVDRATVKTPEGKGLNTMFWAVIGVLVKQINKTLTSLLANINPDFPLWGRCEEITIEGGDLPADGQDYVVKHNLGITPTRWIVCDYKQLGVGGGANTWQITRSTTAWTKTHVFFRIFPDPDLKIKILLLP